MIPNLIENICLSFLTLLIIFYPLKVHALSHDWVAVPKSQYGEQLWDKNSVQKNQDGSIRTFSKFIPKSNTEITQDILYTMDINCSENSFRDVAVGAKKFNEFKNNDTEWEDPNGDKLILGVIDQVCTFGENNDTAQKALINFTTLDLFVLRRTIKHTKNELDGRMPNSDEILDRYGHLEIPADKSQERRGWETP